MKLPTILAALFGGSAKVIGTASGLTVLLGAVYLADCRISSHGRGAEAIDRCYLSALPMMGLGAGVGGGFMAGYKTYNPALRPPDDLDRDEHGRFKKRS